MKFPNFHLFFEKRWCVPTGGHFALQVRLIQRWLQTRARARPLDAFRIAIKSYTKNVYKFNIKCIMIGQPNKILIFSEN